MSRLCEAWSSEAGERGALVVRKVLVLRAAALALGLFCACAVAAQNTETGSAVAATCDSPGIKPDLRPNDGGPPVDVMVGLRLVDVTDIKDIDQTITIDFLVFYSWTDPRLTNFAGCLFDLAEVWTPAIDIINSGRLFLRLPRVAEVLEGGVVRYVQRYRGALVFPYQAHEFPFDSHQISISLASVSNDLRDVSMSVDRELTGRTDAFNIPDWKIGDVQASIDRISMRLDRQHARFDLTFTAERRSGYFIWKVILPLCLIVAMSWAVFWIDPSHFGPQIGLSATSMLTLIAFQLAMSDVMPRLNYFTTMDKFIAGSTVLVFAALVMSVMTSYLVTKGQQERANSIDFVSRWVFPTLFGCLAIIVFVI